MDANSKLARPRVLDVDFLVVGSGIAGLYAAIKLRGFGQVAVLTKQLRDEGNTQYAQGGIAAALGLHDSPALHYQDTIAAGAGLCSGPAVKVMVQDGPAYVLDLIELGARFDRQDGELTMAREGAHSLGRILRAGGDATGQEIESALLRRARDLGIAIHEDTDANRLIIDAHGRCTGVEATGPQGELVIQARGTILATGGAGQVFSHTSNPSVSSGDGMAMAWQAGAELMDMEFFQFHPTALAMPGNPRLLITEAVRGEGALLLDADGRRFMPDYHPQAELAPRDIVARAILREAWQAGTDHVWLDARNLKDGALRASERFPTVYRRILEHGLDMEHELIPVSPVAHYAMGGVRTDTWGRTTLPGLWACGETACLGTHGANRLASNSLLESLVFAGRAAIAARAWDGRDWDTDLLPVGLAPTLHLPLPAAMLGATAGSRQPVLAPSGLAKDDSVKDDVVQRVTERIRSLMWRQFGLVRDPAAMQQGLAELLELRGGQDTLWTVAVLVGQAALFRRESRGAHNRTDYAGPDPAWQAHTVLSRDGATLQCGLAPLANVVEVA